MKELVFELKAVPKVPVEASIISPDFLAGKSKEEIENLTVWKGNQKIPLKDLFKIEGEVPKDPKEFSIRIIGDLSKFRKIGYKMSNGSLLITGNAGMYLGEEMNGGSILVEGNASLWLGMDMKNGLIEVKGNAGDYVGSGYRGKNVGMKGGKIIIHGSVGNEAGCWMKDGLIKIYGNAGMFPGLHMIGGTILINGDCLGRAGAQMKGGKIVILGSINSILPSFNISGISEKTSVGEEKIQGPFYVFEGDLTEDGKGKIFINVIKNQNLKFFENFIET
ncbi:MAG: formylmethanofuran dehydrogenase subunit C [Candidatus Bathyarchaeia archaeon]